jgi:hypothetical protein
VGATLPVAAHSEELTSGLEYSHLLYCRGVVTVGG